MQTRSGDMDGATSASESAEDNTKDQEADDEGTNGQRETEGALPFRQLRSARPAQLLALMTHAISMMDAVPYLLAVNASLLLFFALRHHVSLDHVTEVTHVVPPSGH